MRPRTVSVPRVVVMGVAGSGKSTVGALVAARLGARFIDGDDLHPPENVAKMAAGDPLDDDDRAPWLDRVRDALDDLAPVVVACSALKRSYRDALRAAGGVTFVFLDVPAQVAGDRMTERRGHFMRADMVAGQFDALERPEPDERDVTTVDAGRPVAEVVHTVARTVAAGPNDT